MSLARHPGLRWGLLLAGALAWRLLFFVGPQGSDDLVYSELAHALRTGSYHPAPDIFSTRTGYLACIALGYGLFGAGPFTLVLPNLLFSLAGIVLAYHLALEFLDERGAWKAALLVAIAPPDVFLATEAHTDLPLTVLFSGALLLHLRARKSGWIPGVVLAGVVLGVAHLFKESAFFGLVAMAAVAGRPRRIDAWVLAGFAIPLAVESLALGSATGDAFFRFHSVREAQHVNIAALEATSGSGILRAFGGLLEFVDPSSQATSFLGPLPVLALVSIGIAWRHSNEPLRSCGLWMLALILLSVFWPITMFPYRPALWNHARIFTIAEVPMIFLTVALLDRLSGRRAVAAWALLALACAGCTGVLYADARRTTEGARWAYEGPLRSSTGAVSDPRTAALFQLYDGYRPERTWKDWHHPEGPPLRVANDHMIRSLKLWYGTTPPPGFEPAGPPVERHQGPGRLRLRPLLVGKVDRIPGDEVRIYRVP